MPINLSVPELTELKPRITVFGVGGAGGNAVNNMIESRLEGVEFVVANTDAQAVSLSKAERKIQLGSQTTQGLGAGSIPEVGQRAAEESLEEIVTHFENAHMLFITAGMGGGTGTGAAPVLARAAKERGILTVGVVTKPFHFEGARRMRIAEAGISELHKHVDTLIIIPNQNLFRIANEKTTFAQAFGMADQVLHSGVRGITDLMMMPGLINLDFADVRTVMSEMGKAMMGTGEADGDKRAIEAAERAISNPLLDEVSMKGARGVLINITGGMDMTLFELDEAANRIRSEVDPEANIIVGSAFNQELEGKIRVSVVATGIEAIDGAAHEPRPAQSSAPVTRPWRQEEDASPQTQDSASERPVFAPRADNPVGEVHERIRRMLTEDAAGEEPAAKPEQPQRDAQPVHRQAGHQAGHAPRPRPAPQKPNPFRGKREPAKTALNAAVDMIKGLSGSTKPEPPRRPLESRPRPQAETPRVRERADADLFGEAEDSDLEIPAFLRRKTGS